MKKTLCVMAALASLSAGAFAKKVTLKVWESDGPEKQYVMWAAREYQKVDKNVRIQYEPVASPDAASKMELDGPAGVGPDIFVAPHDHISRLVNSGLVTEVKDSAFINQFTDAAKFGSSYNGKYYGYPLGIETYALFYNKDILKQIGASVPKTWDDVISIAKIYNNPSARKYALVWPISDAYYGYMFMSSFGAKLFGENGDDCSKHNLNSKEAIDGLTYLQNLRSQIMDVPAADITGDFCNSSFSEGSAAMIITGPWKTQDFTTSGINFGITTLPEFPGQGKPASSFSGIRLAFVSEFSENPEEAEAFVKFLTSKENLKKRYELTKQIPPHKEITPKDEFSTGIFEQLKYATPMPTIPQMVTYWSAMGNAYAGVWEGEDVIKDLNSAAQAMDSSAKK